MRLKVTKSKNAASLYVIKSTYENGIHSSKIVEKLGTEIELREKLGGGDPYQWAKQYITDLNKKEKAEKREVLVKYSPAKQIPKDEQRSFNGGYLFLQKIYYGLGLHSICNSIAKKHKFEFNLNNILSRLLYARIIYPCSKLATSKQAEQFFELADFSIHQVYRALSILNLEADFIQSQIYQNSVKVAKRNTNILFYDCTNFFFEIEQEDGIKKYGKSKEHRTTPIVQMGLFMDGDGVPLAFSINPGNISEQKTMIPLEEKILNDFALSRFIVCTDAGLASAVNRKFNAQKERSYINTQPVKKLNMDLKQWALNPNGWRLSGSSSIYCLTELDEKENLNKVFYKERWIKNKGFEERLLVTYSLKYRNYMRSIRKGQVERAIKVMASGYKGATKSPTDCKRFIIQRHYTKDGEVADQGRLLLDEELIAYEAAYDGFYAVCTNMDGEAAEIIKVNQGRWEIEECFRIMKSELKARPVYLSRDDRIKAHFTTCFLALILYRYLEKLLRNKFTCSEIIQGLRDMNFLKVKGEGYVPIYTRNDFTDALHDTFGFRTDFQIVSDSQLKKIFRDTKK